MSVRVKICGLTNLADALAAVRAGADALGFVLAPSPRQVTPAQVRSIVDSLPPMILTVGVFVNSDLREVAETRSYCGLDLVQLHGQESEQEAAALGRRVIKALPAGPGSQLSAEAYSGAILLLDAGRSKVKGGSGQTCNWELAASLARQRPIILAGGLNPDNVGQAVAQVNPYAVDVASGVEKEPGRKDHEQITKFIARAKALGNGT